jgi:hypothetical protein
MVLAGVLCVSFGSALFAVDPNPFENTHWRFEEGVAGSPVPQGDDTVLDSINENHMRTFDELSAPFYTSDVPVAVIPQTGEANSLALDFLPNRDVYTLDKNINNPITTAFTVEAAFKAYVIGPYQAIVGKDGKPSAGPEQTAVLKVRGGDPISDPVWAQRAQWEQFDAAGNRVSLLSTDLMVADRWYYAAIVNDGSTVSFYLDSNDGNGYVLQGSAPVSGALFQEDRVWSVGRGMFNDGVTDWFDGVIDEVRLTDRALDPSEFLFAVPVPNLTTTSIEAIDGDTIRVMFENTGPAATGYGLARSSTPAGPYVEDSSAVITEVSPGVIQADAMITGDPEAYFNGSATY